MPNDFIPARDASALQWMQTFSDGIAADYAAYFVSAATAAQLQSLVAAFAAALADSVDPATRTGDAASTSDYRAGDTITPSTAGHDLVTTLLDARPRIFLTAWEAGGECCCRSSFDSTVQRSLGPGRTVNKLFDN